MEVLVDTNILIDLKAGNLESKEIEFFINSNKFLCPQIILEFLRGEKDEEKTLKELKEVFDILDFNDEVYLNYSKLFKKLKREGKLKSQGDLLIAAFSIAYKIPLWTKNTKDFKVLEKYGLKLVNP